MAAEKVKRVLIALATIACCISAASAASASATDRGLLFSQSAAATLERQFAANGVSWLLLDGDGQVQAVRWKDLDLAVPPGSLVKPFIAWAYGEQHQFVYPHVQCNGTSSHCWLPHGHGRLFLEQAIAQSCNTYFLQLARSLDFDAARRSLAELGLQVPAKNADAGSWIGLGDSWVAQPLSLARAYLVLDKQIESKGNMQIIEGLRAAAETGTGRAVDAALGRGAALAKTGTARCTHQAHGTGDGFAVVMYPAIQPRLLLLVRVHGATGAQAAAAAGKMLLALGAGQP